MTGDTGSHIAEVEAAGSLAASGEMASHPPVASLVGDGPIQYLLEGEDVQSFSVMQSRLDAALVPADPIERMWVDEIADMEWDLHRLRSIRRLATEAPLIARLADLAQQAILAAPIPDPQRLRVNWQKLARSYLRGEPLAIEAMEGVLGSSELQRELLAVQLETNETLMKITDAIMSVSRQRDATISRLYGRREGIASGRFLGSTTNR